MPTSSDSNSTPQVLQTYALLQIASEALFNVEPGVAATAPGVGALQNIGFGTDGSVLTRGNDHSSRMTTEQAKQFAQEWTVVSHQPNTATGFSATLFKYTGTSDSDRGLTNGQYVVSFRSTEFIDDQARDSKATNELEVKEGGWAFGQIADMQTWWNSLQGTLGTATVDVTGYSRRKSGSSLKS